VAYFRQLYRYSCVANRKPSLISIYVDCGGFPVSILSSVLYASVMASVGNAYPAFMVLND
jgi:hypothetical protein